jgi:hypothetical protein
MAKSKTHIGEYAMDAMLNKSKKNKGVAESSLADPGRSGVNGSRTKPKIDTPLTQPRSGPVLDGYVMAEQMTAGAMEAIRIAESFFPKDMDRQRELARAIIQAIGKCETDFAQEIICKLRAQPPQA